MWVFEPELITSPLDNENYNSYHICLWSSYHGLEASSSCSEFNTPQNGLCLWWRNDDSTTIHCSCHQRDSTTSFIGANVRFPHIQIEFDFWWQREFSCVYRQETFEAFTSGILLRGPWLGHCLPPNIITVHLICSNFRLFIVKRKSLILFVWWGLGAGLRHLFLCECTA